MLVPCLCSAGAWRERASQQHLLCHLQQLPPATCLSHLSCHVQAAARDVGRRITVLRVAGAGPDHTLDPAYPEGQYLTNVLLRVL